MKARVQDLALDDNGNDYLCEHFRHKKPKANNFRRKKQTCANQAPMVSSRMVLPFSFEFWPINSDHNFLVVTVVPYMKFLTGNWLGVCDTV